MTSPKYTLIDPLPHEGNSKITDVDVIKPNLKAVQMFSLAIGSDVIISIIKGRSASASALDKENMAKALTADGLSNMVSAILQQDRMDAFNKALASYLDLTVEQVEKLSLDDVIGIGKRVIGFYETADDDDKSAKKKSS